MCEWVGGQINGMVDGWMCQCQIWAGLPPSGSMLMYTRFFCDRHVAGFALIVHFVFGCCYVSGWVDGWLGGERFSGWVCGG